MKPEQHTPTLVVRNFKIGYENQDGTFTHIATLVTPTDSQADGEWDWTDGNGEMFVHAVNSYAKLKADREALLKAAKLAEWLVDRVIEEDFSIEEVDETREELNRTITQAEKDGGL